MNGAMTGLFQITELVAKFAVINLMWLIMNIPIVLLLLNILFGQNEMTFLSIVLMVILAPFVFFPSTAAMFASVRNWIMGKEKQSITLIFIKYYKENYKRSMQAGFILTALWIIVIGDIYYFSQENVMLFFSFILTAALLFIYTTNVLSTMVHYNVGLWEMLKKALIYTFSSPLQGIAVLLLSLLIILVSIDSMRFLLIFFTGSLITYISFSAYYKVYLKFAVNNA